MDIRTIKLIGIKLIEILHNQDDIVQTCTLSDDLGGQIIIYFQREDGNFYGNHSILIEDFSGFFKNNILTFHSQNGKTEVITASEF